MNSASLNQGAVIVRHRPRLSSYTAHVVGISTSDDSLDGMQIIAGGLSEFWGHGDGCHIGNAAELD
jgi:hypothetical protein